jgi:CBS domain-containing protein
LFASFIAVALIWLINLVTNLAFFGRFSAEASSPANTSPDELLSEAAAKMLSARIGHLPVVDPTDPTKLVGYLGRAEFISGYEKSHQEEHYRERSSLLYKAVKLTLRRKVGNIVGAEE